VLTKQGDQSVQAWAQGSFDVLGLKLTLKEPVLKFDPLKNESTEEQQANAKKAIADAKGPGSQEAFISSGVQTRGEIRSVYSFGWKFKLSPYPKLLDLPFQVELEYSPKPDFFAGKAGFGGQVNLPFEKVPLTLRIVPGVEGGFTRSVSTKGVETTPVLGPAIGVGAGLKLGSRGEVFMSVEHFHNFLKRANDQGVGGVTDFKLGAALFF
jgi:hypothetical protein